MYRTVLNTFRNLILALGNLPIPRIPTAFVPGLRSLGNRHIRRGQHPNLFDLRNGAAWSGVHHPGCPCALADIGLKLLVNHARGLSYWFTCWLNPSWLLVKLLVKLLVHLSIMPVVG